MRHESERGWPDSPYKGLGFYTEADAPLFAGRVKDTRRCAETLAEWNTRILLLHGSTGCGKSSFLRAGLIPHLEDRSVGIAFARAKPGEPSALFIRSTAEPLAKLANAVFSFAARDVTLETPSGKQLLNLRQALPDQNETDSTVFLRRFGQKPDALLDILRKLSRLIPETLVLIIDQGEEVLTVDTTDSGSAWRDQFFEFLSEFAEAKFDIKLLIALRTEYLGRFAAKMQRGLRDPSIVEFFLAELSDDQIRDAIERPTVKTPIESLGAPYDHYRFSYEDGVVETIVQQLTKAAGGKLSALQTVCIALHEAVDSRDGPRKITLEDFKNIGGVEGSIERFLDSQLQECGNAANLPPVVCAQESVRWKEVLTGLAREQADGTITTDLKPAEVLQGELADSRFPFESTTGLLTRTRLLRETNVVDVSSGELVRCFGLGHDTLGIVLRNWKVGHDARSSSPVQSKEVQLEQETIVTQNDIALCLSGGGYRSMLFNLGALWRLNELAYLPRLARISGVSGGAIVTGLLGAEWKKLTFINGIADNFQQVMVAPLRRLASQTIDASIVMASILPGSNSAAKLADHLARTLYGKATLQDLPDQPVFVISATNLQCASLFRFSKAYLGGYEVGQIRNPTLRLANAVAASGALGPLLSPLILNFRLDEWQAQSQDITAPDDPRLREKVYLTEGALCDHLGLESAWRRHQTIFVSDGGAAAGYQPQPSTNWVLQITRQMGIMDIQLRHLRQRQVLDAFATGQKQGAYWSIRSQTENYRLPDPLPVERSRAIELSEIATRYASIDPEVQDRLINWGYAICDTAVRANMPEVQREKRAFPYVVSV